jgi:uncharacterized protein (TIGR00369 family)
MSEGPAAGNDEPRRIFEEAPFTRHLGLKLEALGPGWCHSFLEVEERHLQQDGFVHAGVQAAILDHTAGAAGATMLGEGQAVLSIEFKVNLLRPAKGRRLVCRAKVLKGGRTVTVAESELFTLGDGEERLVSKATVTLANVPRPASGASRRPDRGSRPGEAT